MKKLIFVSFLIFKLFFAFTQNETEKTLWLQEVEVQATKSSEFSFGLERIKVDSFALRNSKTENLSGMLTKSLPVYIKSYGQGSLASISFRGTAPEHNGVYWNGFKINSPNIGIQDLALIPSGFFNSIEIVTGGFSSMYGSNIGSGIHLGNELKFGKRKTLDINLESGSFGHYQTLLKAELSGKKFWSSTAGLYEYTLNNFDFTNLNGQVEMRENALVKRKNIIQELAFQHHNNILKASVWWQSSYREIPKTLTMSNSYAHQEDQSLRTSLGYQKFLRQTVIEMKTAMFIDDLLYHDPETNIESEISTIHIPSEILFKYTFHKNLKIINGLNYTFQQGISTNYPKEIIQHQIASYLSTYWKIPVINWNTSASIRIEQVDKKFIPFVFSAGAQGKIWNKIHGRLNISRNYRLPSFNDLYWVGLGNPKLKPEDAFSSEAGIFSQFSLGKNSHVYFSMNYFNIKINDRIIWKPQNNVWRPENIGEVLSRGFEIKNQYDLSLKKISVKLQVAYAYTKATKETDASGSEFQKQLIYVPKHNLSGSFQLIYKNYYFSLNHFYYSERFTLSDNSKFLEPYHIENISLSRKFLIQKSQIDIKLSINNLWNTDYEAIQYYPVPGRSLRFSFNINL